MIAKLPDDEIFIHSFAVFSQSLNLIRRVFVRDQIRLAHDALVYELVVRDSLEKQPEINTNVMCSLLGTIEIE